MTLLIALNAIAFNGFTVTHPITVVTDQVRYEYSLHTPRQEALFLKAATSSEEEYMCHWWRLVWYQGLYYFNECIVERGRDVCGRMWEPGFRHPCNAP